MNKGLKELYKVMVAEGYEPMSCAELATYLSARGWKTEAAQNVVDTWQRILEKPNIGLRQSECTQRTGVIRRKYLAALKEK